MAIARHFQTTVSTSATAIDGTQYPGFVLQNLGGGDLFIGGSGVTVGTGYKVPDGTSFSPSEKAHESLRGIIGDRLFGVGAANRDVRVLLTGKDPNA